MTPNAEGEGVGGGSGVRSGGSGVRSGGSSSSSAAALDEPLRWIALAVHHDEGQRNAEQLLQVPLEAGRLYDSRRFAEALRCLQQAHRRHHRGRPAAGAAADGAAAEAAEAPNPTQRDGGNAGEGNRGGAGGGGGPAKKKGKAGVNRSASSLPRDEGPATTKGEDECHHDDVTRNAPPPHALTPVVLSGLITALQQQRQEKEEAQLQRSADLSATASGAEASCPPDDLSSELVLYCHALRGAALRRTKIRNGRRRVRRWLPPLAVTLAVVIAYLRSIRHMRAALVRLRYVRSCDGLPLDSGRYESACRLAETELWERYGTGLLDMSEAPASSLSSLAMHSVLAKPTLTRQDVEAGRRIHPPPLTQSRTTDERGEESIVNRLVREAVEKHRDPNRGLSILDVGCGVGGTLYSLLPLSTNATWDGTAASRPPFRYRGFALSAAEVHHAIQLARRHAEAALLDVAFAQRSFDSPLDSLHAGGGGGQYPNETTPYTVVVAVESLSYSRNLRETLANLLAALPSGGIMVIVDDVVLPSDAGRVAVDPGFRRPSLVTHHTWNALLLENECPLVEGYDLTFEHQLVWTGDMSPASASELTATAAFGPAYWPLSSVLNLVATSSETLWRRGVWWERWFASSGPARRMVQLHYDRADRDRAARKRMEEYSVRDSFSYHLYVCRKQ